MATDSLLSDEIGPETGLLVDTDIRDALNAGQLFVDGTFDLNGAKYSTYEIRVGCRYDGLRFEGENITHTPIYIDDNQFVDILPGHTIRLFAAEEFLIRTNVFAKVTVVGQIFSSGLSAENTFADPGYSGPFYITLSNISTRTLSLKPGSPLARVEFYKLHCRPTRTHVGHAGQRRPFIRASVDNSVRQLLHSKTIGDLVKDMVDKSLDEALQQRSLRSEVLLEKVHTKIQELAEARRYLTLWRSTAYFLLLCCVFALLRWQAWLSFISQQQTISFFVDIFAAMIAAIAFYVIERRVLRHANI